MARFLETQRLRADRLTSQLTSGEITVPEWEQDMRWIVKDAFGASYLLGRGGRNSMTSRDWGRLGRQVREQYRYLNGLASEMVAGSLSPAKAAQRAMMYPLSGRQAFARGAATALGDPDLPAYPGDGSTACFSNCGCFWTLERTNLGDGRPGFRATWVRGKTDSCGDCLRREREWAPLLVPVAA